MWQGTVPRATRSRASSRRRGDWPMDKHAMDSWNRKAHILKCKHRLRNDLTMP